MDVKTSINKIDLFNNYYYFFIKQMESRIIYQIKNFVSFLFGENNYNDPEQKIYNKHTNNINPIKCHIGKYG